ncbi:MAG: PepSY domain-containing protein [Lachnospiraceae bacterium]|nr:PepSY domain-containing protein [Lachnospiraceae bacterium]
MRNRLLLILLMVGTLVIFGLSACGQSPAQGNQTAGSGQDTQGNQTAQSIQNTQQAGANSSNTDASYIGEEKALSIALEKVPGATFEHIRINQEWDDGRTVYEGKISYNDMEYDFEIDATTGNIISWEAESIYD